MCYGCLSVSVGISYYMLWLSVCVSVGFSCYMTWLSLCFSGVHLLYDMVVSLFQWGSVAICYGCLSLSVGLSYIICYGCLCVFQCGSVAIYAMTVSLFQWGPSSYVGRLISSCPPGTGLTGKLVCWLRGFALDWLFLCLKSVQIVCFQTDNINIHLF